MVVVEGVARSLDPQFNMWKASEPVVGHWIAQNLGPLGKVRDVKDGLEAVMHLASLAPELANRTQRLAEEIGSMAEYGLRLDQSTVDAIAKAEAKHNRYGRWSLVLIAMLSTIAVYALIYYFVDCNANNFELKLASITIRNLDDASKQWLRNRAAANNRSMEEEARLLFSAARDGEEDLAQVENSGDDALPVSNAPLRFASLPAPQSYDLDDSPLADKHILLILCGGIANYKCLDLIRRLRERHANVSVIMTEAAQKFITPLTVLCLAHPARHILPHLNLPRQPG